MQEIKVYDSNNEELVSLVRWDRDVYIHMSAQYITAAYNVHFFNQDSTEALVVESAYDSGVLTVKIPNSLLEVAYPICGCVYIQDEDWRTAYWFKVLVKDRPQPNDYISSDSDDYLSISLIQQECSELLADVTAALEAAQAAQQTAEESVADITSSVESAAASAASAQESQAAAEQSATDAATAATAAQTAQAAAETSAAEASSDADRAEAAAASAEAIVKDSASSVVGTITAEEIGALPTTGGTMTGSIEMSGQSVTGLATPTADTDAANKSYVDAQVSDAISSLSTVEAAEIAQETAEAAQAAADTAQAAADTAQAAATTAQAAAEAAQETADGALMKTGGTMTGSIDMGEQSITNLASPSDDSDAVTKSYVDSKITTVASSVSTAQSAANSAASAASAAQATADAALPLVGGTMSGVIYMGQHAIKDLFDPTEDADAATKVYVDDKVSAVGTTASTALDTAYAAQTTANNAASAAANAQTAADDALAAITKLANVIATAPSQSGTLTYTGSEQSPTWNNYDSEKLTIGGTTSATEAGTYTATFTPTGDYVWSDYTQDTVEVAWTIGKVGIRIPTLSGTLTYTGSEQSPSWDNYDSATVTIGGITSATDAGEYTATFTPKGSSQWLDGTTTTESVVWSIEKAEGSLSLSTSSLTLTALSPTATITVTRSGDGEVTASSSDTSIATVSVSGTTVTVTGVNSGSATITVSVGAGTNHTAASSKTCVVTANMASATLADNSPATIQAVAQAGTAANYWSVGDTIGIALSGTVGSLTLSDTYYAFIIGFDHNSSVEGSNTIHFQFGKTSGGVNIAFVDSLYGDYDTTSTDKFKMNTTNTNSGGWKSSTMRTARCEEFLSAMPTAWQNVIASCTKYSDNTGGGSDTASYVTSTSDQIWLLSEFEVQGSRTYANSAEQNYQKQYDYYANGNSKIKYRHSATTTTCNWWLRSVRASASAAFCRVSTSGSANYYDARFSYGFAPGFKVA